MSDSTTVTMQRMFRADMVRAEPKTANDEARTVEMVWTTGARVRRRSFWSDEAYDEELSLDDAAVDLGRLNNGAPLLNSHNDYDLRDVIGVVEKAWIQGPKGRREGRAVVRFSDRADVEPIWRDVRSGILRNISVGYSVRRMEKIERKNDVPLMRAVEWEPAELSVVPVPADAKAQIRADAETYGCTITVQPIGDPMDELTPRAAEVAAVDTPAETRAAVTPVAPEPQAPQNPALSDEDVRRHAADAVAAERQRSTGIYAAAQALRIERTVADKLVADGVSLDAARAALIEEAAKRADATGIVSRVEAPRGGLDATVTRGNAVVTALMHRSDPAKYPLTDAARGYMGMSLLEIARDFLSDSGVTVRGLSRSQLADAALQVRGGLHTTSDFPNLLADVANKSARRAYEEAPQTWRPMGRRVTAPDFKNMNRIALDVAPALAEVNEHGEFTRGTIADSKEAYGLATYGKVVGVTRKVIINDDLDMLTRLPAQFGRAAARKESDLVWAIFTGNPTMGDGTALFHANHGNLTTGPGTALAEPTLSVARALMRVQKAIDATTLLNISPKFVCVPVALESTIEKILFGSLYAATSATTVPSSIRSLTPISDARLDAADNNAWFLVADPADIDTFEYAYLEGDEGVYTETRMGFDVDGVEVKVRLDFAAKAIDWRGFYKNDGA